MSNRVSFMVKIFRIELEEVENDIHALMDYSSRRFEKKEISPYVWQENKALLVKEVSCLKELEGDLENWSPAGDKEDIASAVIELTEYLKNLVVKHGYPELVSIVIDRISEKVSRYIE